jgi:GTP-binding protein
MKNNFTVLIAGRENVGKSSIFNKLINRQKSIVDDFPGVTRDKIYGEAEWMGKKFTVIDTGGLLFNDADLIKTEVVKIVRDVIRDVDLVLFVVDATTGIVPEDREVFDFVRGSSTNFVVVANKVDTHDKAQLAYEFYNLGVDKVFPVSAAHSYGLDDLLDYITEMVDVEKEKEAEVKISKVAILGRENVGKSTLFNSLVKEERSIVTDIPGTTRDSIDTLVEYEGKKLLLIDTAGVKKRKNIKQKVEGYSIGRAFMNIKRGDICILVLDCTAGVSEVDKKILGYAAANFKAVIIAANKWDLIAYEKRESEQKVFTEFVREEMPFAAYAPIVFISAKDKKGLEKLIEVVFYVENQYNFRVKTGILNKVFQQALHEKAIFSKKGDVKIYYISQVESSPPTFAVFVNKKQKLAVSYLRYLENRLRATFGFEGVPIRLKIKTKEIKAEIKK